MGFVGLFGMVEYLGVLELILDWFSGTGSIFMLPLTRE